MFVTQKDHHNYLMELASENPDEIIIATYGIYAGILHTGEDTQEWGGKYLNCAHTFLDAISECPKVRIIVGLSPLILCKEGCEDCLAKHFKSVTRIIKHAEKWPKYDWKYANNFHLKCYLFKKNGVMKGIVGGRNLSDSNWTDITFKADDKHCKVIEYLYNKLWSKSIEINQENLENISIKQFEEHEDHN